MANSECTSGQQEPPPSLMFSWVLRVRVSFRYYAHAKGVRTLWWLKSAEPGNQGKEAAILGWVGGKGGRRSALKATKVVQK